MISILNILFYHPVSEATPNSKITGAYCTYSSAKTPQPPAPRIWAHIRRRNWAAKIDDISLWPPGFLWHETNTFIITIEVA